MASSILANGALRAFARPAAARSFQTSTRHMNATLSASEGLAMRRPVGAFRGGFIGFLLGSSIAAYGTYSWVLKEYRLSNELLTEDIYMDFQFSCRPFFYLGTLVVFVLATMAVSV